MFEQLKRPRLRSPRPRRPARLPLKSASPPAQPVPNVFTRPLERPSQKKRRKACPACEASGKACSACQKKTAPTLERPPSGTQMRRGSAGEHPAERQADELGEEIGDELKGTESVGHGPLPKSVQNVAEAHLGISLEGTRVDAGVAGQKMARDESALAVTEGKRIAFGEGQLDTSTSEGRALLGHELVHVGQQTVGPPTRQRKNGRNKPVIELVTFPPESPESLARRGFYPVTRDKRFWKRADGSEVRVLSTSHVPDKPGWFSGSMAAWFDFLDRAPAVPTWWAGNLESWLQFVHTVPGEVPTLQGTAGIEGTFGAAEILQDYGSSKSRKNQDKVGRLTVAALDACIAKYPGTSRQIPEGKAGSNQKCCVHLVMECFRPIGDELLGNPECPVQRCKPQ